MHQPYMIARSQGQGFSPRLHLEIEIIYAIVLMKLYMPQYQIMEILDVAMLPNVIIVMSVMMLRHCVDLNSLKKVHLPLIVEY
jgi:hypothetical protein